MNEKIIGLVNPKFLVKSYYEFIIKLKEQMKDKLSKKAIRILEDENP